MADVPIPYLGGPLDGDEALLDESELVEGRTFDFRPWVLEENADPDEVHRYKLDQRDGRWIYRFTPIPPPPARQEPDTRRT